MNKTSLKWRAMSKKVVIPCPSPAEDVILEAVLRYLRVLNSNDLLATREVDEELDLYTWAKQTVSQLQRGYLSEMRIVLGLGFGGKVRMKLFPGRIEAYCDLYPENATIGTELVLDRIDTATASFEEAS